MLLLGQACDALGDLRPRLLSPVVGCQQPTTAASSCRATDCVLAWLRRGSLTGLSLSLGAAGESFCRLPAADKSCIFWSRCGLRPRSPAKRQPYGTQSLSGGSAPRPPALKRGRRLATKAASSGLAADCVLAHLRRGCLTGLSLSLGAAGESFCRLPAADKSCIFWSRCGLRPRSPAKRQPYGTQSLSGGSPPQTPGSKGRTAAADKSCRFWSRCGLRPRLSAKRQP